MTGTSFLTTTVANQRVAVEIAWGADVTDLTGASWTWSDVTTDVVLRDGEQISIGIGRPDFSQVTQTATMTCRLDNRTGGYSEGGLGTHWPYVRRGTPVRVRVSNNGGTNWYVRFQGAANGFTPQWDPETGRWATVELSASGPLRRLDQGTGVVISAMREGTLADSSVVAYLPCEDRQHAKFIAPAVGSATGQFRVFDISTASFIDGIPGECASYADIPSSGPLVTLGEGGGLSWSSLPPNLTSTNATVTLFLGNVAAVKPYDNGATLNKYGGRQIGNLFTVLTEGAPAVKRWDVNWRISASTGALRIWLNAYATTAITYGTATVVDRTIDMHVIDNMPMEFGLSLSQSGSTTNYRLFRRYLDDPWSTGNVTGSVSSNSGGSVVSDVQSAGSGDSQGLSVGHIVIRNTIVDENYDTDWADGYPGETVTARLTRLCTAHGIPLSVLDSAVTESASITDTMGPQFYDTLTNLLRECETTGQGLLYDGLAAGLTYVTKKRRESNANGPAMLTLDAAQAHLMEPFAPVDDDQLAINHVDVTRRGGTAATFSDLTGPVGVDAIGDYSNSLSPNPAADAGLVGYAQWGVHLGTQEGYRYPSISFALQTNPSLIAGWLACTPQSRVDITNITAIRRQHPDYPIRLLLEGWTETIGAFEWEVTANTSAAEPWNVAVLAAATGSTGDGICHLDTDGSQLNANAVAGATSISVKTNTGPLWVTSAGDADSFPFDIDLGGCKATVTAVSGASSPQTFTLSAGLPRAFTGSATVGAGVPIKIWRPPVFGL